MTLGKGMKQEDQTRKAAASLLKHTVFLRDHILWHILVCLFFFSGYGWTVAIISRGLTFPDFG